MVEIVSISGKRPYRRVPRTAEGPSSHPVSCRVPADVFRRMTQLVESPNNEFTTKSDLIAAAIILRLDELMEQTSDDPGWIPYKMERQQGLRDLRERDYMIVVKIFERCQTEGDRPGLGEHLINLHRLHNFFVQEGANTFELNRIRLLIEQVKREIG